MQNQCVTVEEALLMIERMMLTSEHQGLLPVVRHNRWLHLSRKDDTLFFSSSAVFLLQRHWALMSESEQTLAQRIIDRIILKYPAYKNPNRLSFNFWTRTPRRWFPGGRVMRRFKYFDLPDDVDSSAMVMLTGDYSRDEVLVFYDLLKRHANTIHLSMKNGLPQLRTTPFYSTWLGEKMPIELDVCVLSNLMYLFLHHNIPFNDHDEATRDILIRVIDGGFYEADFFRIAPEYPRKALVLYHLARLLGRFPDFLPSHCHLKLCVDVKSSLQLAGAFDRMLLNSALLFLGEAGEMEHDYLPDENHLPLKYDEYWFTAGFLSVFGNKVFQSLAPCSFFHYRYYSVVFNWVLWIENQLLVRQKE